jgi:aspartyl-tRNA synthetase
MSTAYRTHTCGQLRLENVGERVTISGWVHRKRDHGPVLFLDLRDHYGITQIVVSGSIPAYETVKYVRPESVLQFEGTVVARTENNRNRNLATGEIEIDAASVVVLAEVDPLSDVEALPFSVSSASTIPEELRLRYRFLDLRRERMHANVVLRSQVISSIRRRMTEAQFLEIQTPILTSSSPEGARDYLVPSRKQPGKFYALPQAPQQFKQLLMVAGFDRYFQIAPCFRDEDARADRSPGEFYQLDIELSFVSRDDIFAAIEPVLYGLFKEFSDFDVTPPPFPRIRYADAIASYGSDKPDLRNPLVLRDVTSLMARSGFKTFSDAAESGAAVVALVAPGAASRPRRFFDDATQKAQSVGARTPTYLILSDPPRGPLAKHVDETLLREIAEATGAAAGDAIFFVADARPLAFTIAGALRTYVGDALELIEPGAYRFCWITDFPFYEKDESGAITFSHNPFSMPVGGLEALTTMDPLTITADQYDIVCNGVELSSGAVRNHRRDVMLKAFEIAGYSRADVEERFAGLFNAFRFGAPPHGGLAPGIDRIVMLLAKESNIREVIAFPLNQHAEDLMMNAPSTVLEKRLEELHIRIVSPPVPDGQVAGNGQEIIPQTDS